MSFDQKSPIWVIYEALIIYLQFVMGFEVAVPCVLFTENVWQFHFGNGNESVVLKTMYVNLK